MADLASRAAGTHARTRPGLAAIRRAALCRHRTMPLARRVVRRWEADIMAARRPVAVSVARLARRAVGERRRRAVAGVVVRRRRATSRRATIAIGDRTTTEIASGADIKKRIAVKQKSEPQTMSDLDDDSVDEERPPIAQRSVSAMALLTSETPSSDDDDEGDVPAAALAASARLQRNASPLKRTASKRRDSAERPKGKAAAPPPGAKKKKKKPKAKPKQPKSKQERDDDELAGAQRCRCGFIALCAAVFV